MQRWRYCAIQLSNNQLFLFNLEPDREVQFSPLPEDAAWFIDKDNPGHTIRRWTAALGLQGWELVNVIVIEKNNYQEWMFKQPIEEDHVTSLWKDQPS